MALLMSRFGLAAATGRKLTPGEIAVARSVFGEQLDYRQVRIHSLPSVIENLGGRTTTPFGDIYLEERFQKPDLSQTPPDQALLIHEITHVWQHQHGRLLHAEALS